MQISHKRIRCLILLCTIVLATCCSLFVFVSHRFLHSTEPLLFNTKIRSCRQSWTQSFDQVRQCLKNVVKKKEIWSTFIDDVHYCVGWRLWRRLDSQQIQHEHRSTVEGGTYFIEPKNRMSSGTFLSLGIKNDVDEELFVKKQYPQWSFIGLDSDSAKKSIYDNVGLFYNYTISNSSYDYASVHYGISTKRRQKWRQFVELGTIDFIDFVSIILKRFSIDYLSINSRSIALSILPQLIAKGAIEHHGIAVCQTTVNIPTRKSSYDLDRKTLARLGHDLVIGNSWLPLRVLETKNEKWKLFLINTASLYCLDKFFSKCQ